MAEVADRTTDVRDRVLSLPDRLRPAAAAGLAVEIELTVDGEPFTVSIVDGTCSVRPGMSLAPTTRLSADADTWLGLDAGSIGPSDALLGGHLGVRGNVDLAVRMLALFEPHGRPRLPTDIEHLDVDADGLTLSCYVFGEGPPVVLLHGLGATKVSWMPVLQPLAAHFRVIVPDLPGHGDSDKPRADYSPAFYAEAVRTLMDGLGVKTAALVGNSMGGRIALEVAASSPRRVTRIALLDPAVPGTRWRAVLGFMRFAPPALSVAPFPVSERWMQLAIRRLFARPDRLPDNAYRAGADEFQRVYRSARARFAFWSSLRHIVLERGDEFFPRMRAVKAPALVLWGEDDRLVPVRLGNRLADELPASELVVMPDVGHVPQFEAPRTTNAALLEFLSRNDANVGPAGNGDGHRARAGARARASGGRTTGPANGGAGRKGRGGSRANGRARSAT